MLSASDIPNHHIFLRSHVIPCPEYFDFTRFISLFLFVSLINWNLCSEQDQKFQIKYL